MTDETIFAAALEKADPAERSAYLDVACGDNAALRKRIEGLLAAHDRAVGFLERPAVARPEPDATETRAYPPAAAADGDTHTHGEGADDDRADALAFLAPAGRPDSLGRIGHYEVLEVLGKGGFGIVFRAFDEVLQRVVAVKMLAPSMAATSPARKRFLREARSSAQVHHANVVQIHATEESPLPYLVMEFIPGETLQQRLDRTGPLEVPEVLRVGRQIAEGLAAAHATGLIHRDIKPSNILIHSGSGQQVKITDFGLARAADDASLTRSGTVAGTPMYMAPEQAKGEPLDHRADLFSLGSVLYVMCSGRPPFRAETTLAVLKRVAEDDPRPIREIIPETPQWLCRIVEKLHAKDPADRFQTAREVADLLADCEQQLKAHGALRDFTRIPGGGRPKTSRAARRFAIGVCLLAALFWGVILFGEPAYRYVANRSEIQFGVGDSAVKQLLVHRGGELVATLDRANPRAELPPGTYDLTAVCEDGYEATKFYEVFTGLFLSGQGYTALGPTTFVILNRGAVVTVMPTAEKRTTLPVSDDKSRLQGRWRIVGAERNGKPLPIAELKEMDWIEFTGDKQKMYWAGQVWPGTFTLNTAAEPREMDFAGTLYGSFHIIYRFDGDRLVMAQAGAKQPRPTSFTTTPETKFTVATYVRDTSPPSDADGWVQLFNGKDTTGWKTHDGQPGSWHVVGGVLVGTGSERYLFTERGDYRDFHLKVEAKISPQGNSGVHFRSQLAPVIPPGYEAQINIGADRWKTGSLFVLPWNFDTSVLHFETDNLIVADEWFTLEVLAQGPRIEIKVKGKTVADVQDRRYEVGHIALQAGRAKTEIVQFSKIEIKELPPDRAAPAGQSDHDQLQGKWLLVSADIKSGPRKADGWIAFTGDRFTSNTWGVTVSGTFRITPTARPKELDVIADNKPTIGITIYQLDGDELVIAEGSPGSPRPTAFTAPGPGQVVYRYRREKAAAPPSAAAPFDAATAQNLQSAWAKHLSVPVVTDGPLGMKLALIPPGEFTMGSSSEEVNDLIAEIRRAGGAEVWSAGVAAEAPPQRVRLTRPWLLSTREVTVAQFRAFVEATEYKTEAEVANKDNLPPGDKDWFKDPRRTWKNPGPWAVKDDHPVLCVSWNDAVAFCKWVSETTGRPCRLPTEAEWEFACRAGSDKRYSFGADRARQPEYTVPNRGAAGPAAVGSKKANAFGLFDMEGNAWEWCGSRYGAGHGTAPQTDPQGPAGSNLRAIRGGGFPSPAFASRCATRWAYSPQHRDPGIGFRIAFDLAPPAAAPALRELVAAKEKSRDTVKQRVAAGVDTPAALTAAEIEVVEARIKLAEAEQDRKGIVALYEELVRHRAEERRLVGLRVQAGVEAADAQNRADAHLADAQARLATARAALPPPEVAPAPRPKQ